ncbi:MAG: N-acetylmuramoyl-L-alanine amidase [Roseovarius sp.]
MIGKWLAVLLAALLAGAGAGAQERAEAQGFSALARLEMAGSGVEDMRGGVTLRLVLTQGVPYRAFTLADPERLVLDFREVDWTGTDVEALDRSERVLKLRVGAFRPGWSRMVVDLMGPYALATADAAVDAASGRAVIEVVLKEASPEAFAAASGAPPLPGWEAEESALPAVAEAAPGRSGRMLVVLDPGHGGVDPGAENDGAQEKELMLRFARELRETLLRAGGFDVALTREADEFVSLERRVAIAHELGADLFISLHADALSEGRAVGATVYTLADSASDEASAALAERHNRANILAGVDLTDTDDVVADVLMDLARMETQPRSDQLARAIRLGIREQGLKLNTRPLRSAGFSVLKSPDIPSVLVELGFLSSMRDLENLRDPDWRARMAAGIRDALQAWRLADEAAQRLVRQ